MNLKNIIIFLLVFSFGISTVFGETKQVELDKKIDRMCNEHMLSKNEEHGMRNGKRCSGILKSIYRFETGNLKYTSFNNIFNFKSNKIKGIWGRYGVVGIKGGFLIFKDKTSSISFAVNHYYTFNYRKTIRQIVAGGKYRNLSGRLVNFTGYTANTEHHRNYISFIKKRTGFNN